MRPEKLGYLICTKLAVSNLLPKKTRAESSILAVLYGYSFCNNVIVLYPKLL